MHALPFFVAQFLWFLCAWSLIAWFVVWPRTREWAAADRLSLWIAPQMFRVLGVGLLVENLSPGMPSSFSQATAAGDTLTASLGVLAFIGLRRGWSSARGFVWACTIVGVSDLLFAFPHAAHTGAIAHLSAQWYVPVFAGPIMVVAHAGALATLLATRSSSLRKEPT